MGILVGVALVSIQSEAAVLFGNATGFSVLSCMAPNTTGRAQVVDQVQYDWTCNYGPLDPFHPGFQVEPCFAGCSVGPGETFFQPLGPFTGNCPALMRASCVVFTHDAPQKP